MYGLRFIILTEDKELLYDIAYIWNLKYDTKELINKTDSQI